MPQQGSQTRIEGSQISNVGARHHWTPAGDGPALDNGYSKVSNTLPARTFCAARDVFIYVF